MKAFSSLKVEKGLVTREEEPLARHQTEPSKLQSCVRERERERALIVFVVCACVKSLDYIPPSSRRLPSSIPNPEAVDSVKVSGSRREVGLDLFLRRRCHRCYKRQ